MSDAQPPADSDFARLFRTINLVVAGEPAAAGMHALADNLVGSVAVMHDTCASAERFLDTLLPDLKRRLRLYWPDIVAAREAGDLTSRPAGRA